MSRPPVPAILALWAAGYPSSWIADVLGMVHKSSVKTIVQRAREVGDKRAVFHRDPRGHIDPKTAKAMLAHPDLGIIDELSIDLPNRRASRMPK